MTLLWERIKWLYFEKPHVLLLILFMTFLLISTILSILKFFLVIAMAVTAIQTVRWLIPRYHAWRAAKQRSTS